MRSTAGLLVVVVAVWAGVVGAGWLAERRASHVAVAQARAGDILMVASVDCRYCAEARAWFRANDLPFSECLIERDAECAATYRSLQAPGTPVLIVRGKRLVGFDARSVAAALR